MNRQIQIVSRDKDLAQLLLTERDCLWDFSANKHVPVTIEEFGVSANNFQFLAWPGLPTVSASGIGAVKAGQLLREFGTLAEIYHNLDAVAQMKVEGQKLATVLKENQDMRTAKAATIVCEVGDRDECFEKYRYQISLCSQIWMSCELWLSTLLVRESNEIVKQAAQLIKDSQRKQFNMRPNSHPALQ